MKYRATALLLAAAAAQLLTGGTAAAAPLMNLSVDARPSGSSGAFSRTLTNVAAGQSFEYRVVLKGAAVGTSNAQGSGRTVASINDAVDGMNSLFFNLSQPANPAVPLDITGGALNTNGDRAQSWTAGSGALQGTPTARGATAFRDLLKVRPIHAPAARTGMDADGDVVMTGLFTVMAAPVGAASQLQLSWADLSGADTTTAGGAINGGANPFTASFNSEKSADPFVGYLPLTVAAPVPEPAAAGAAAAAAAAALLARRRARRHAR